MYHFYNQKMTIKDYSLKKEQMKVGWGGHLDNGLQEVLGGHEATG